MSHDGSGSVHVEGQGKNSAPRDDIKEMTPEGVRRLLTDLGSTATTESVERDSRVRVWKWLHYIIGTVVAAFGTISGAVVLTSAGMTKEQAGVLLLIGGAITAAYTFLNTRERMNTNFLMRDEYDSITRETTEALTLANPKDVAKEYRRIKIRYEGVRKADSASRGG